MTAQITPRDVLLVEDDPGDRLLVEEVFLQHGWGEHLAVVEDGQEALEHLAAQHYSLPDLVLLDLNLPKVNGREVLEAIKADPALSAVPVVVLTTSDSEEDIVRAYTAGAAAYVRKPLDWADFTGAVEKVRAFYFELARLPHHER